MRSRARNGLIGRHSGSGEPADAALGSSPTNSNRGTAVFAFFRRHEGAFIGKTAILKIADVAHNTEIRGLNHGHRRGIATKRHRRHKKDELGTFLCLFVASLISSDPSRNPSRSS
ncbi:MAG: hypothetical protein DMG15_01735 [Acidobacteria bacterium]|nr:MAG: hypothetical protein DMG15_01735 [Acidobacteriota bacterium]